MAKTIVIYQDEGVGAFGLVCLQRFFEKDTICLVSAAQVVDSSAFKDADLFVMPGGADLPYCKKLNGAGNKNIRAFVENGGTYLGICAGAYYACRDIEYHKGREDEICETRELALIKATAIGSLPDFAPHYDDRLRTVAAVKLLADDEVCAYYHGGCLFNLHEDTIIHARYPIEGTPPAVVENKIGNGRAILSGVHLEIAAQDVHDYPLEDGDDTSRLGSIASSLNNTHQFLKSILGTEYQS
jgi:glutamine amidotransferase-like uncharacterized protein